MYNLTDINTIKRVMSRHGVTFSKALGQNFIIDPEVCPLIVEKSGVTQEDGVLEIGPGVGVLTQEIAKKAKKLVALELDTRLIPVLGDTLEDFSNVEVINADVMKTDLERLFAESFSDCENIHVIANLPYYITSPIIMMLLESRLPVKAITVMVQKEAGERLCADVGSRDAGAVSLTNLALASGADCIVAAALGANELNFVSIKSAFSLDDAACFAHLTRLNML